MSSAGLAPRRARRVRRVVNSRRGVSRGPPVQEEISVTLMYRTDKKTQQARRYSQAGRGLTVPPRAPARASERRLLLAAGERLGVTWNAGLTERPFPECSESTLPEMDGDFLHQLSPASRREQGAATPPLPRPARSPSPYLTSSRPLREKPTWLRTPSPTFPKEIRGRGAVDSAVDRGSVKVKMGGTTRRPLAWLCLEKLVLCGAGRTPSPLHGETPYVRMLRALRSKSAHMRVRVLRHG
ncbi:hypothetical protein SKAU_G00318460 [Synaphobranchus kaupii]|uniref:Uncharacterized protein n=1 Tax=Synaphobranchus kaupii TaxID=118154 RepID=A0A9Q1ILZ2_SYNKA|nr:hypothetical protein SKAU_G00318460 [Synaphobranchus kaupii]